jgi:hypothetical protein
MNWGVVPLILDLRAEYTRVIIFTVSRMVQSVQCLATCWTTGRSRFDHRQRHRIFSILCVQTGSGDHPASCPMGTGGPFPGLKGGRDVTLTTHPHLVPRSWMSRSLLPLPPSAFMACSGTALFFFYHQVTWQPDRHISTVANKLIQRPLQGN